ncbi:MAG: FGGY family carbohydrate kinase [Candidatus Tectomicrobia bacterium]|nr:FGGY family carbohydrate kinase [Candidatus Tectomicrobia bacterium]
MGYLLGYDIGSSAVKAALVEIESGSPVAAAVSPADELPIQAPRPGWAEQDPGLWWTHVVTATHELAADQPAALREVKAIGLSYQMHGLVLVDRALRVLRPAILWCDSRAAEIGHQAFRELGAAACMRRLLNSPGNFTASRLKWVKDNEPDAFARVHRALLPGDYVAMRMTGETVTTPTGLSEGILWDYTEGDLAQMVLSHYGIPASYIPPRVPVFSVQGLLRPAAAAELGVPAHVPLAYRSGDQPNNALALNVLEPGEMAATAGTSAVVFAVSDTPSPDTQMRVNTFLHVNHERRRPRYGTLLCINGAGSLYRWLRHAIMAPGTDYADMNRVAAGAPIGADGLTMLPFGNGAERLLQDRVTGGALQALDFNRHTRAHLLRAAQEGIVFALHHGLRAMGDLGLQSRVTRAPAANLFLSPLFRSAFATLTNTRLELYDTNGAQGAARAAGLGAGMYRDTAEALRSLEPLCVIEPEADVFPAYREAYERWCSAFGV